jgi:adenylate cyclase
MCLIGTRAQWASRAGCGGALRRYLPMIREFADVRRLADLAVRVAGVLSGNCAPGATSAPCSHRGDDCRRAVDALLVICHDRRVPWTDRLPPSLERLAVVGVDAGDTEDERLDKAMFTLIACLLAVMAFAWVAIYLAIGLPESAAIPFVYQLAVVGSLVGFARTKRFLVIRTFQLVLMLMLPFALQWSLGGFANGSAVAAWAGITPILAYLFGARSGAWFIAFVLLLAASAGMESTLAAHAPHITSWVRAVMWVMNLAGPSLAAFFALAYFTNERDRSRAALTEERRLLEIERDRSEQLLLNILPAPIAHQLRHGRTTIAESQPAVTILFADIVGFTPLAEGIGPGPVVKLLNDVFSAFDDLADAAGLEKIKTVGDAYMVAGGIPTPRPDHLAAVLDMALQMGDAVARVGTPYGQVLQLRIGIDSGPVVAGVIGRRKFSYDLWGDTVNSASRMESHGVPGRVQVTERVARAAQHQFEFEPRGPIDVKGKGPMRTYLLVGPRDTSCRLDRAAREITDAMGSA